jgi:DNA phosphorothioation-associated putative methyltransferase
MREAIGKLVATRRYFHVSAASLMDSETTELVSVATNMAGVQPERDFNVVRIDSLLNTVGLLSYPRFFDDPFPTLLKSWIICTKDGRVSLRKYDNSLNPPVLHRKELLLESNHARRALYSRLTSELESQGFFDDPVRIGFKVQWDKLLAERGFRVVDHQLVPIGNVEESLEESPAEIPSQVVIERHRTALSRHSFSAPVQILRRFGMLDSSKALFDYGCGRGDDVKGLVANGINASGWDPYYAADNPILAAPFVNLGFVINVIEDPVERRDALQRAFALAEELLVVSTMVATENIGKVALYGDGVLTSRSTFQKYYAQSELREYLKATLKQEPIAVAPGIFFVFKDKDAEQRFQVGRLRSQIRLPPLRRPARPVRVVAPRVPLLPRPLHQPLQRPSRQPAVDTYELHRELFDVLWKQCLDLGREPVPEEVVQLDTLQQAAGSYKRALRIVLDRNDSALLARARQQRSEELKVFFALQQFQRRQPCEQLEATLRRDVKAFFDDYRSAQEHAKDLLFQVANPHVIDSACRKAAEEGIGHLEESHSLQLHSSLVCRLPAALRVYVGCAAVIYGDPSEADLIKIHIRSGKVSFMKFDDFFGVAVPRMTERTKVNLRTLDLQVFSYGDEYACPLLYLKSRFMNEELPNYAQQATFDEELQRLQLGHLQGFGPSAEEFAGILRSVRLKVEGYRLTRDHFIPALDERCGRYFTYRQLIECGETQAATGLPNLPRNAESFTALFDLAVNVLDPLIDYFGGIELTYGFCSQELAKKILRRIAPELDQHAAHENKRNGNPVCARLGAAVDFLVRDENMREVAQWIIANLPFDRLYFYGEHRPLHLSYGPQNSREAVEMFSLPSGRRMPRPFT